MITLSKENRNVLITGGTRGIGLETAFKFAEAGANVFLTYKWGSADLDCLSEKFGKIGSGSHHFFCADVAVEDDTSQLMEQIGNYADKIDVFVSNVAFAPHISKLKDYKKSI